MLKKYFVTGLVILLPVALTIVIIVFIFNLLTQPFAGMVKAVFDYYGIFSNGFLFLSADQLQQTVSQLLTFAFLFFSTLALGMIARGLFLDSFISFSEAVVHRIPFVSAIYRTTKDIVKTMFNSSEKSFKQVVLVPFPSPEIYSVGLITRENLPSPHADYSERIAVFIPTTPNPTCGFLMMYHPAEIRYLDMKVEDAFKFIVSCGVLPIPFKIISKEEALVAQKGTVQS